jgi:hypothetical protein
VEWSAVVRCGAYVRFLAQRFGHAQFERCEHSGVDSGKLHILVQVLQVTRRVRKLHTTRFMSRQVTSHHIPPLQPPLTLFTYSTGSWRILTQLNPSHPHHITTSHRSRPSACFFCSLPSTYITLWISSPSAAPANAPPFKISPKTLTNPLTLGCPLP